MLEVGDADEEDKLPNGNDEIPACWLEAVAPDEYCTRKDARSGVSSPGRIFDGEPDGESPADPGPPG